MKPVKFLAPPAAILLAMLIAPPALAGTVNLATEPLAQSTTSSVLPNLMFVLDDSGSMGWTYLPDSVGNNYASNCFKNSSYNRVYYNPAVTYTLPLKSNGDPFSPAASFSAARNDGFYAYNSNLDQGVTNLGTSFRAYTNMTNNNYNDTAQPAYYYKYIGANPAVPVPGTCYPNASYTKVVVGAAEQQNFANWYSFYRLRMLMMKTAVSQAFKQVDNRFRVGYLSIDNNTENDFLNVSTFDTAQKNAWYNKVMAAKPGNNTPLRSALSAAGLIYAGVLNGETLNGSTVTDPMQYSCQQNFTLLSTDGFWNTRTQEPGCIDRSGQGCRLDRTTGVGEQDATETRPMFDGMKNITVTTVTPTVTTTRKQTVTPLTTTTTWRRTFYSWGAYGADTCSATKHKRHDQKQLKTRTVTESKTSVDDYVHTSTRTVVTVNGVITSDTTATSDTVTNISTSTTPVSDITSNWFDSGAYSTTGNSCTTSTTLPNPNPTNATNLGTVGPVDGAASVTTISTDGPNVGVPEVTTSGTGGSSDSLADVAEYYYRTDLRDPTRNNCTSPDTGYDVCKNNVPGSGNDNSTQQHMTTFTLGLGVNGTLKYSSSYQTDTSGDFYDIKTGAKDWPVPSSNDLTAVDDLWHAAVNGRGVYFSATDPASLVSSLNAALAGVSARLGHGTAAATSTLEPISGDNTMFIASYTTADWTGNIQARLINTSTGALTNTISWCVENVAADALTGTAACTGALALQVGADSDTRNIKFRKGTGLSDFTYDNLSGAQQALFDSSLLSQYSSTYSPSDKTAATGATLVEYLRGQTQYEYQSGSVRNLYRDRKATLGDIVDSSVVYVQAPYFDYTDPGYSAFKTAKASRGGTLYAGANDGMLHAFNSTDGSERWAYVPGEVMANMYRLADFNYANGHRFFVDGVTMIADICKSGCGTAATADWHTVLVGALAGGGKGYYALDVTDPTSPVSLWEYTGNDVGYAYGNPLAVKKADGTWVILVTSGYNNGADGYLYVLDPFSGDTKSKIATGAGSNSGLSRIEAWSDDYLHDSTAQYVYGGDLLGNLWRFDIEAATSMKITTLKDAGGNPQPITARPALGSVDNNRIVYVATGKYLESSDLTDTQVQSVYAIKDDDTALADARGATMVSQTMTNSADGSSRTATSNTVDFSTQRGWYLDFPDSGERDNVDPLLLMGTLVVPTNVPTNGICEAGGYSWLNYFNYKSGSYVSGATTVGTKSANALISGLGEYWLDTDGDGKKEPILTVTHNNESQPEIKKNLPFNPPGSGSIEGHRVSWRELIQE